MQITSDKWPISGILIHIAWICFFLWLTVQIKDIATIDFTRNFPNTVVMDDTQTTIKHIKGVNHGP